MNTENIETNIDTENWIVIINRKSGKRKFIKQTEFVKESLQNANISFDFVFTQYKGHATELARTNANKGYTKFLILGGDGTICEVVNGIMKSDVADTSKIKIALIPRGTGNDWARFWNMKKNDKKSVEIFLKGKTKHIDVGEVVFKAENQQNEHKRFFINSIGFGLDAVATNHVDNYKKVLGSFSFLYTVGTLHALLHNGYTPVNMKIDDKEFDIPLYHMNIANGSYSGGGIKQNPNAVPYDGLFDMIFIGKIKFWDVVKTLPNLFNGKILKTKVIHPLRGKRIEISSQKPLGMETDGILLSSIKSCKVEIKPNALQMIVPE